MQRMNPALHRIKKARCFLVYALAPEGMGATEANQTFNSFVGDRSLPLPIYHDHFIGQPGGVAVFFVASSAERDALMEQKHLAGWRVELQPLIYATDPAAFDEQTAFTLRTYRGVEWEAVRRIGQVSTGDRGREADTAEKSFI